MTYRKKFIKYTLKINRSYLSIIDLSSKKNNIHPEILFGVLVVEQINRGDWITRSLESVASIFFPRILIKLDVSLGFGQIKISTAKTVTDLKKDKDIVRSLVNVESNIELAARLLADYYKCCKTDHEPLRGLVNLYGTGRKKVTPNKELNIYYSLLSWSVSQKMFLKTLCKN